jgi:hypothetical protein
MTRRVLKTGYKDKIQPEPSLLPVRVALALTAAYVLRPDDIKDQALRATMKDPWVLHSLMELLIAPRDLVLAPLDASRAANVGS